MRYPKSEKAEIIELIEQSHLPAIGRGRPHSRRPEKLPETFRCSPGSFESVRY